jgi:putative ATPase
MDLFGPSKNSTAPGDGPSAVAPLAERMRPQSFDEVVGIASFAGPDAPVRRLVEAGSVPSMVFWGPPGTGKTTLARIVSRVAGLPFIHFSAVTSGVKDVRAVLKSARHRANLEGRRSILFVDEIHHFNKSQQDAFLPYVEDGTIVLIGATIENPSFYLNRALLSRARVVVVDSRSEVELRQILARAVSGDPAVHERVDEATDAALERLAVAANGDARRALNLLEDCVALLAAEGVRILDESVLERFAFALQLRHDRRGDDHYDLISAFIKSIRGSDPDAALVWLAQLLEAGEDPLFVLRRLVILASEDVGNADPRALQVVVAAVEAFRFVGMPEGALAIAQATTYLATAPKSNASYVGLKAARRLISKTGNVPVPPVIRNAPTSLMKHLGNAEGYEYPHDFPHGVAPTNRYLPEDLDRRRFYEPVAWGAEKRIREYLDWVAGQRGDEPKS